MNGIKHLESFVVGNSVGSNPVRGSEFGIFGGFGWVCSSVMVGKPGFGRVQSLTSRVRSSLMVEVFSKMFIVVGFVGSEFWIFGGFGWVCSLVLVGKPGFERVRSSTSRVRSSLEFIIFGFDPTLVGNEVVEKWQNSSHSSQLFGLT